MRVQLINNNNKYNQNNIPFKAYIKPNANFHILYGYEKCSFAKAVKQLNELPDHCIEILKLNKLKTIFDNVTNSKDCVLDKTECIILNETTKRTANIILEDKYTPLDQLIKGIIRLKDKPFFKHQMLGLEADLYETLTTGKPLNKVYIDAIEKSIE